MGDDTLQAVWSLFDADEASYLGDEGDGVAYMAVEHEGKWWALALVDAEHFSQHMPADGPYDTAEEAEDAAYNMAFEWVAENFSGPELAEIML